MPRGWWVAGGAPRSWGAADGQDLALTIFLRAAGVSACAAGAHQRDVKVQENPLPHLANHAPLGVYQPLQSVPQLCATVGVVVESLLQSRLSDSTTSPENMAMP